MKKVLVDFVAHQSIMVAINDDDDIDIAIDRAEEYMNAEYSDVLWDYENDEEVENSTDFDDVANINEIHTCENCGTTFVDLNNTLTCPKCGAEV